MCILISGRSFAETTIEPEQQVVVKTICNKKEYKLNMVKSEGEWYIRAEDLANLADVKCGYNEATEKIAFVRKEDMIILYNGECIFVDGKEYVPAVQASVACGIRFCEYKGELRAERLRTLEDLRYQLSERVFGNSSIDISRAIVENPGLMGSAMVTSESYQILTEGLLSGIIKYMSGDVHRERYEKAMTSLLEFDDSVGSLIETIEEADELLVKLNKYISKGEGAIEAGTKEFYQLFMGMSEDEAEWQVFLEGLDEYGDFASVRYLLEDYAVASKVVKSLGGMDLISNITSLYDAQASVLYTMEDVFRNSETKYAVDAARVIMGRYEKEGIAIADGIDTIAKSLVYSALDEIYEKGFDMEIKFSENPKLFLVQIGEEVVFDKLLNVDDKAEFVTLMPVYSDLQLDIKGYFYRNHWDIGGAKMRGAGIMYLNAALHYFELLKFDKNIDLSSTIDYMNKELADILSYEEDEYLQDYDNAALIQLANNKNTTTTSYVPIIDTGDSTVNSNSAQELIANNDDLLFAYAQLLNTVVLWSNDKKATHYQLFDKNEDGIPEIVTYNTAGEYGAAFACWSYSNGIMQLDFCSGKYYYYSSLCIGDQKEVYSNESESYPYQNIEVLVNNYNVVGGIEIGSSKDIIYNTYRFCLQEKYRSNIEMWGSENSHVLLAYADVLKSGVTIWESKNTLATHYWLYDKNSDGIPELLVFGRDSSFDSLGFKEYGYIDGKVEMLAETASDSIYYSLSIYNGVECCLNKKDYEEHGRVEKLVQNGHIIGGIRIGSSDDYLIKAPVVTVDVAINEEKTQLSVGDYVQFGTDYTWQVINIEDNIATLFFAGCFRGVFDASLHKETHAISLMRYLTYGSATWEYSDVRQWLNSRELSAKGVDVAFDYSNLAQGISAMGMSAVIRTESDQYAYSGKAGFLCTDNFNDKEYWLIEPTEITSIVPYTQIPGSVVSASSFENFKADMGAVYSEKVGQTKTIDRMFLLNGREIKEYLLDNGLSPFVFTSGKTYPAYWLRDSIHYGTYILTVDGKTAGTQQADMNAYIRPACNINLAYVIGVNGEGTSDNPYKLDISDFVINRPLNIDNMNDAVSNNTR